MPSVTGPNPTPNHNLPPLRLEHAHRGRGVPKPRPAARPENPRVEEDCEEKLTMEGSGATRSRRRLAGGMEPVEAARVEKEAAIGGVGEVGSE